MSRRRKIGAEQLAEAAFGRLRDEIWLRSGGTFAQVTLIASARPGEGRTTIAAGLAKALAKALPKDRILLVDADLRQPRLQEVFGLEAAPGLSEALRDGESLEAAVRRIGQSPLHVLPAGEAAEDACMLLASGRMADLVNTLRKQGWTIVLDSPPLERAVEAQALTALADCILLVVRADRTVARDAQKAQSCLAGLENGKIVAAVVNDVRRSARHLLDEDRGGL